MCLQGPDTHPRKQGCRHRAQTQGATCTWGQSRRGPEPGAAGEPPPRTPHSVCEVHEDWVRGSCGGTRSGDPTAGLKPTQPRERSLHAGHVARPAQGPGSPGRGTPTPTEVVPQRPEEVGGAARPLGNMMGWGQRPEGSARPGCWRHRAGQGLRTRPGWTGGSGRRTQGRDGHSAGDKEVTWGCRVLSRLPEPA